MSDDRLTRVPAVPRGSEQAAPPPVSLVAALEPRYRACGWLVAGLWIGLGFVVLWVLWKVGYWWSMPGGVDRFFALVFALIGDPVGGLIETLGCTAAGGCLLVGQFRWLRSDRKARSEAARSGRVALAAGVAALALHPPATVFQFPSLEPYFPGPAVLLPTSFAFEVRVFGALLGVAVVAAQLLWVVALWFQVRRSLRTFPWGDTAAWRLAAAGYYFAVYAASHAVFAVCWFGFLCATMNTQGFSFSWQTGLTFSWPLVLLALAGVGTYFVSWVLWPLGVVSAYATLHAFAYVREELARSYGPRSPGLP